MSTTSSAPNSLSVSKRYGKHLNEQFECAALGWSLQQSVKRLPTMKKIMFILPNLNGGGAERVAVTYLRSLNSSKFSITLVLLEKTESLNHLLPPEVEIKDMETHSTSKSLPRLIEYIKKKEPDVVFTTHSRLAFLVSLSRLFTPKFEHIARMQGSPKLEKKEGEYGVFKRLLYSIGFRSADIVIAQTAFMKNEGSEVFRIPKEKITVLNNPIDKAYINQALKTDRKLFTNEEYAIVSAGRLSYEKGFDLLLLALPKVIERIPNVKLHILGEDRGHGEVLYQMVRDLEVQDYVSFHGFISNPYPFYEQCDLFALTSRHEGFPNAFLENYYLNTPIVATRCAQVIGELIDDGVNGYLADVSDVGGITEGMIKAYINLSKADIDNPVYMGSELQPLFDELIAL